MDEEAFVSCCAEYRIVHFFSLYRWPVITQEFVLEKLARRPLINMDQLNVDFTQGEYDRSKAKLRDAMSFGKSRSSVGIAGSIANAASKSAPTATPVVKPLSFGTYLGMRGLNIAANSTTDDSGTSSGYKAPTKRDPDYSFADPNISSSQLGPVSKKQYLDMDAMNKGKIDAKEYMRRRVLGF